jgi:glycosyltransferase involved in cell wall biosynthesis
MRVGVVVEQLRHDVPGGIGTYVRGLLGGLQAIADADLELVGLASRARGPDPLVELGVELQRSKLGHRAQMLVWDLSLGGGLGGLDVLHLTSAAGPIGRRSSPATSAMVHDLAWRAHPELTTARGRRWHEAAYRRLRRSGAVVVTPSTDIAEQLLADGVDPERITVIAEGCDHLPAPDLPAARAELGARGVAGPFLLTVSTLEPRKNLDRLIAAAASARARLDGLPLVVVGPAGWGPDQQAPPGVILLGRQPPAVLAGLYEDCRAFAYVPLAEGFGLPPLEAMSQGAVVVASTAVPSVRLAPGVLRVDPLEVDQIAEALVVALSDEDHRTRAMAAARTFAGGHRWRDCAAQHLELWRRIG